MTKLYFGASYALNQAAYSYILPECFESKVIKSTKLIAEYQALNKGLERALSEGKSKLLILGPKLVIDQLEGITPVKSFRAVPLYQHTKILLSKFRKVSIKPSNWKNNKAYLHSIQTIAEFLEGKAIAESKKIPSSWIQRDKGLVFNVGKYTVDLREVTCNCSFFIKANSLDVKRLGIIIRCKHIFATEKFL